MKNIFSRFLAKSILGLSLLTAPALSLACGGPVIDALGIGQATQTSLTLYVDGFTIPSNANTYSIAYRVSGSNYWYFTPWNGASLQYVFNGPFVAPGVSVRARALTGLQSGTAYDVYLAAANTTSGDYYESDVVYGSTTSGVYTSCYKPSDVFGESAGQSVRIGYQVDGGNNYGTRVQWGSSMSTSTWSAGDFVDFQGSATPYSNSAYIYMPYGSYFRVGVKCTPSGGTYTWSSVFQANGGVEKIAATNSPKAPSSLLSVYPNPSNGAFRLTFNTELEATTELNVLDVNGKTVLSQMVDKNETDALVDMTGNTAGVYFLKFNGETKKIVLR